jgi:DNA-binding CsgD family transcriptional regulator
MGMITICPNCSHEFTIKRNIITDRELEVVKLLAVGYSNKEIAEILYLSVRTVKNHVGNVFRKVDIETRVELIGWLIQNNHIDPNVVGTSRKVKEDQL